MKIWKQGETTWMMLDGSILIGKFWSYYRDMRPNHCDVKYMSRNSPRHIKVRTDRIYDSEEQLIISLIKRT